MESTEKVINEKIINEGKVSIKTSESIFYNPHMELNRDISSLFVGALKIYPELNPLAVCDGMSASGIRGLRYLIENDNVDSVCFVDGDESASKLIQENIELNAKISSDKEIKEKTSVFNDDINHHLYRGGNKYNFVELDPFGSPVPFIRSALLNLRASKEGILSVTATDTAVLCGAHPKACIINYGAKTMHNWICHEVGLRILIGHIVNVAAPMHIGVTPMFSISKRHYMKTMVKTKKSAKAAFESMSKLGYVSMCEKCLDIKTYNRPNVDKNCQICGSNLDWAGPLWLGELYDANILDEMIRLNNERNYAKSSEISKLLEIMRSESKMPPFYYDLHAIADHFSIPSPKFSEVESKLATNSFSVSRTHFNPTAIKTDARITDILEIMGINISNLKADNS